MQKSIIIGFAKSVKSVLGVAVLVICQYQQRLIEKNLLGF